MTRIKKSNQNRRRDERKYNKPKEEKFQEETFSKKVREPRKQREDKKVIPNREPIKKQHPNIVNISIVFFAEILEVDSATKTANPNANVSNASATESKMPSVFPAAKPTPKSKPSITKSIPNTISKPIGRALDTLLTSLLLSTFSAKYFIASIAIIPKLKPIPTSIGLCFLIISGNNSTATTEKTTPPAKCKTALRKAPLGLRINPTIPPAKILTKGIKA